MIRNELVSRLRLRARPRPASGPATSPASAPGIAIVPLAVLVLIAGMALPLDAGAQGQGQTQGQGDAQSQPAAQPQALAILTRAADRYAGMSGFCADFRQVVENDILRQTTRSRGELCQRRPDRFEMRFTDPAGDRVVADGRHLWAYFPSTNPGQAFRTDPGAAEGRFDLHREFLSEPGERYAPTLEGEDIVDGRRTHRMMLRPTGDSPFLRARIWVDASDSMIRKLEIVETEGFVRTVELTALRLNPSLPDARFTFEVPAGVRVVSR